MSMDYNVFLNDIDDSKIQEWIDELNKLGMECEVHPEFSFKDQKGFLPFKIIIKDNSHEALLNKEYLTGFEYYLEEFNIDDHTEYLKQSFIDKILRKPRKKSIYYSEEIDEKLKDKKYVVTFNFGIQDTFELRMASLGSATLSKITNGLCCYANDGIWYDNNNIVENALNEVSKYEISLNKKDFRLHEFEKWL